MVAGLNEGIVGAPTAVGAAKALSETASPAPVGWGTLQYIRCKYISCMNCNTPNVDKVAAEHLVYLFPWLFPPCIRICVGSHMFPFDFGPHYWYGLSPGVLVWFHPWSAIHANLGLTTVLWSVKVCYTVFFQIRQHQCNCPCINVEWDWEHVGTRGIAALQGVEDIHIFMARGECLIREEGMWKEKAHRCRVGNSQKRLMHYFWGWSWLWESNLF